MTIVTTSRTRRHFLSSLAIGGAGALFVPGAFAEQLVLTPRQIEGPFYPKQLPLDTDNDLIVVNAGLTPAVGVITHLTGRVLDGRGTPVRNAVVEIWQVDHHGVYLHPGSNNPEKRDTHFQGFGRFLTGSSGDYYFRTVKPVPYPGRTPHIHFAIRQNGRERLTTQCYIKGDPGNARDSILQGIRDTRARDSVLVDFTPMPASTVGELQAKFDIILGVTPPA